MKTRIRRNLLRIATTTAVVCAAALVFVPALAAPVPTTTLSSLVPLDTSISSIRIR